MTSDQEVQDVTKEKRKHRDSSPAESKKKSRKSPEKENNESDQERRRRKRKHRSRSRSKSRSRSRDRRERRQRDHDDSDVKYRRYYGEDEDKQSKQNSDRYWTKYPKKDDNRVGARYYEPVPDTDDAEADEKKEKNDAPKEEDDREGDEKIIPARQRKTVDLLTSRTGGAYIPPAKLRMMQAEITDKNSPAYQRIAWEALKKSIHGYINKVNTANIGIIARELLHENIVRGRGLLCKSIIQAQAASPTFTNVYAALVAVINSKFPNIGELLLKRLVLQFKRGFKQNNKMVCISAAAFIAHLVNQRVAHEILALEILTLLVESPTDDSVEVAISFLKECGQKLTEVSSKGINAIFEMLRNILHEGQLEKRIQYMIEVMFQVRKDGFKDHAAIIEELDVVEEEDQITHLITLDDVKQTNAEDILNVFKFDENYEENEGKYKTLSKEILGSDDSDSEDGSGGSEGSGEEEEDDDEEGEKEEKNASTIIDNTETNLIALRRTIYLTIQSSLDFQECAHKLMKMELKPGQEIELCHMFLDCCAEQRTYEKFYGLLAQRFCEINNVYVAPFQQIFQDTYATTHRLDTNRLRNVSKFFAHLLFTDAISWEVMEIMKMNEEDTNSSSRVFIKILFQELAEYMGLGKLNARLKDPSMHGHFAGLFPRDNPKNTRFAINFFTSIGLGGLTDELREHLKAVPKTMDIPVIASSSSSSSESSSSSDSSDDESSASESSSSEDDKKKKTKKKKEKTPEKTKETVRKPHREISEDRRSKREINKKKPRRSDDDESEKESSRRSRRERDEKRERPRPDADRQRRDRERDDRERRRSDYEHRRRR